MATQITRDEQAYVDTMVAEYGPSWDDTTDLADRYAEYVPEYTDAPRTERITRKGPPHTPGTAWSGTSCLCSCHYGARMCDERECAAWGAQNAAKVAKVAERKARAWARRQAQVGA